jgi:hypothetical protein
MFIIEEYPLKNPNYHKSTDTVATLNLDFHYHVTRSLVAAIAHMTGLDSPQESRHDQAQNSSSCFIDSARQP